MTEHTLTHEHTIATLTLNTDPYLSCDDCFDQADLMIERLAVTGEPLSEAFATHLRGCPTCLEEAITLAELTALEQGSDPDAAASALRQALTTHL